MRKIKTAILGLAVIFFAATAGLAADLPPVSKAPSKSVLTCPPWGESRVAALPTKVEMSKTLHRYYKSAVYESKRDWTLNSTSSRFVWAVQASNACGTAIGYISSGEVNAMRFWNCECYYARMVTEHSG